MHALLRYGLEMFVMKRYEEGGKGGGEAAGREIEALVSRAL